MLQSSGPAPPSGSKRPAVARPQLLLKPISRVQISAAPVNSHCGLFLSVVMRPFFQGDETAMTHSLQHPLLKTTLTGLRRTYLRFLVFRPKLTKTKRFPPFLDHMNGKLFLGGSRFWSGKIGPKLAVGGHWSKCPAELSFIFNRCPAGNPLFLTDKIYF